MLLALCDRLLDGDFTAEDRAQLEALVLGDAEMRKLYVEVLHQHAALRQSASRLGSKTLADTLGVLPEPSAAIEMPGWRFRSAHTFIHRFGLIAAVLVIGAGLALYALLTRHPALATLVEVKEARWESSSVPTETGAKLGAGRLRLAAGTARIVFRSGAEVSLEGPADLELLESNACFLHSGALVAHVPEPAHGFQVRTESARLIDHGTDFGISADTSGRAQIQVLQGEVEIRHPATGGDLRLTTHQSASVTPERLSSGRPEETEPDRYAFARVENPAKKPFLTLTTSTGAGDAAYAVSPNSPLHYSDTLLLVKNSPDKHYLRKAFLRFDLSALRNRQVADAALTLNFEASGFGYATLSPECAFAVYGVTDDSQNDWSAASLTWENAPAFSSDGGSADAARAVKLGTFVMPPGVVSGAYTVDTPELAAFLTRDAHPRATLIVVRETSVSKLNAAVHGFAGNRHPTLAPPTLRLTLAEQ
jgi:FecR protein